MKFLIGLTAIIAFVALYVVWLRPLMRRTAWGAAFLERIEPLERALWWKSETILWARSKIVTGLLLTVLTQAGSIDITPLMPFVPDAAEPFVKFAWNLLPLVIAAMGWIDERLRKETTKPLEIVAMRTDAPIEVKVAAAEADAANANAVAAAQEAKAV
jgi:hypothetical protein